MRLHLAEYANSSINIPAIPQVITTTGRGSFSVRSRMDPSASSDSVEGADKAMLGRSKKYFILPSNSKLQRLKVFTEEAE